MAQVNRETLKSYFRAGSRPTGKQFEDLIDSMSNVIDDGLARTEQDGLKLAPLHVSGAVLEFFRNIQDTYPIWKVVVDTETHALSIIDCESGKPAVTLTPGKPVFIRNGLLSDEGLTAKSFSGNYRSDETADRQVAADGKWHTIPLSGAGEQDGCRAYRIVAGYGKSESGDYALLEATAMHCYGKKKRIRTLSSWIGCLCRRIRLRWHTENGRTVLQIRTRRNYGKDVRLRYRVTELWNDYYMNRKLPQQHDEDEPIA